MGNVRLSYAKGTSGAEIIEENNYCPFGMKHEGYNPLSGNPAYKYQFGGKELQKETGWNDFGARMYMSDIGRWGVVDPLAEVARAWTPYRYAYNNPIRFIDPDGRIERSDIDKMMSTGGSYNYSNGNLNYLGGGNPLVSDMYKEGYYTGAVGSDVLDGGGSTAASDPTPKNSTGPGLVGIIINWLFGGKKKEGKLEVGQVEHIPLEEKKDMTWSLISAILFGNADPYSAIGNAGVGPYAEERENVGMAAMIFINPEAAAEGLERNLLKNVATKEGSNILRHYTSEAGYKAIMESGELIPSIGAKNARHGSGQYLTDLLSHDLTSGQVSRRLFGVPWNTKSVSHFIEIDVRGLNVIKNAPNNFLIPNTTNLPLNGIIVNHGASIFKP